MKKIIYIGLLLLQINFFYSSSVGGSKVKVPEVKAPKKVTWADQKSVASKESTIASSSKPQSDNNLMYFTKKELSQLLNKLELNNLAEKQIL